MIFMETQYHHWETWRCTVHFKLTFRSNLNISLWQMFWKQNAVGFINDLWHFSCTHQWAELLFNVKEVIKGPCLCSDDCKSFIDVKLLKTSRQILCQHSVSAAVQLNTSWSRRTRTWVRKRIEIAWTCIKTSYIYSSVEAVLDLVLLGMFINHVSCLVFRVKCLRSVNSWDMDDFNLSNWIKLY